MKKHRILLTVLMLVNISYSQNLYPQISDVDADQAPADSLAENFPTERINLEWIESVKRRTYRAENEAQDAASQLGNEHKVYVTIYMTLEPGRFFQLEQLNLYIDGDQKKELHYQNRDYYAFLMGGAQIVFEGILPTIDSDIEVRLSGIDELGKDVHLKTHSSAGQMGKKTHDKGYFLAFNLHMNKSNQSPRIDWTPL